MKYVFNIGSICCLLLAAALSGCGGSNGGSNGGGHNIMVSTIVAAGEFASPRGIAIDPSGNLYVTDNGNNAIKKIDTNGIVSTFAAVNSPRGIVRAASGDFYVVSGSTIKKVSSLGVVSDFLAGFGTPRDLVIDSGGANLYVVDIVSASVKQVTIPEAVTSLVDISGIPGTFSGWIGIDSSNNLYISKNAPSIIGKVTNPASSPVGSILAGDEGGTYGHDDGVPGTFATPADMAIDGAGNVYVADTANCAIRKITTAGKVSTLAGDPDNGGEIIDGDVSVARMDSPEAIAVRTAGSVTYIYFSDFTSIRKIEIR